MASPSLSAPKDGQMELTSSSTVSWCRQNLQIQHRQNRFSSCLIEGNRPRESPGVGSKTTPHGPRVHTGKAAHDRPQQRHARSVRKDRCDRTHACLPPPPTPRAEAPSGLPSPAVTAPRSTASEAGRACAEPPEPTSSSSAAGNAEPLLGGQRPAVAALPRRALGALGALPAEGCPAPSPLRPRAPTRYALFTENFPLRLRE